MAQTYLAQIGILPWMESWIGGVPKKAMKLILDHFYCQELSHQLTDDEYLDLIIWADYFAAPAILKTCMDFLLRRGFSSQLLEFTVWSGV